VGTGRIQSAILRKGLVRIDHDRAATSCSGRQKVWKRRMDIAEASVVSTAVGTGNKDAVSGGDKSATSQGGFIAM
jgi:hypothetical protein